MKSSYLKLNKMLGALILGVAINAHAELRESVQMNDILPEITPSTLVVFDLDNTLHEPAQSLGSDQWYGSLVKANISQGMPESAAIDAAIKNWVKVQHVTQVKNLETATPEIISSLQNQGIRIFGLTARPTDLADVSLDQLKSINIDLSKTSRLNPEQHIPADDKVSIKGGVVFVGPKNNKGMVLKKILELEGLNKLPSKIIFVDDKLKHVTNVENALNELQVPYVGFRYGAADEKVKNFDSKITDIQFSDFLKILSDKEAQSLIQD